MNSTSPNADAAADIHDAEAARNGAAPWLAAALADTRKRLLRQFDAITQALDRSAATVPLSPEFNPLLWELGHVGWFEEYWISRNPQRRCGSAADAAAARATPRRGGADALYNSSEVPHARRWQLGLPDAARTRADLQCIRERTLALLQDSSGGGDDELYFYRLALLHEDMHREAWVYMAQNLGVDPGVDARAPQASGCEGQSRRVDGGLCTVGSPPAGFAFDNELGRHEIALPAFDIDAAPVSWSRFLPFVDAGGYDDVRLWTREGWAWRKRCSAGQPRYLERIEGGGWQRRQFGQWLDLEPALPAMHLSHHEALAWCRWAGRRLPSEAEWEHAAVSARAAGEPFDWGEVWEWTASGFMPYPGFVAHPYRDYSAPWFDGRPVLRGGSFATAPRLKHPHYRNYFSAERNDIFAGFRSCAA